MIKTIFLSLTLVVFFQLDGISQCNSWNDIPEKDAAENAHVIYRQALKTQQYKDAFTNWKIAYTLAPAADGQRNSHFIDGIEIYRELLKNELDETKVKEYKEAISRLYDEAIACYQSGGIALDPGMTLDQEIGFLAGRKVYDQFYTLNSPYDQVLPSIYLSLEKSGNKAEYIIFDPASRISVYQYKNGKMTKDQVLDIYSKLSSLADYNIANNKNYSDYYSQSKDLMNSVFAEIEDEIFDCQFFVNKFKYEFEKDSTNLEAIKYSIAVMKKKNCPENEPFLMKMEGIWGKYAAEENARLMAEYEANNPGAAAKKLYDQGDYDGAISKYEEAISQESDPEKKAQYLLGKASVQFRKLGQYSTARSTAYEAAKLKPNWGAPYMLIGDMYGTSARNCGDAWNQRLAIIAAIDKYAYAKSIDSSVSGDATSRIATYSKSLPEQETGFMRGIKEGQKETVGCWIGETVSVRYK